LPPPFLFSPACVSRRIVVHPAQLVEPLLPEFTPE
jgi:hypothetical protein